ncbi:MAG: pyridoxal phosphate-dependent aminotransferase [Oscillospiraceae bacterium]|nr:pyridoxal phosphate-dependent aminotransferase [Oscillospiraceae bacterium]
MINEKMLALGESRSAIREIFEYGRKRAGEIGAENVFDFSLGNPSVPAPEKVNETIAELVKTLDSVALHGYTSAPGDMAARAAAAAQESLRAGYDIPAGCIYMTCGAAASLTITLNALINPGDEVVVLAPFFPEYRVFAETAGAKLVTVPPEGKSMQPDMEKFAAAIGENTKAVIVNSPNNPSGAILSADTLRAMAAVLEEKSAQKGSPVYLIADEPYRELVYGDARVPFLPGIYKNSIVCYSYSKSLSLPGERIGYIMVPPCAENAGKLFAAVCGAGRALGYVCAPSLMQKVAAHCAGERPDVDAYRKNRDIIYGALTEMGFDCVSPDGAFYLFVKSPGESAAAFCEKAKEFEILLVPSDSFGVGGYVRLSYCVAEQTIRGALPGFEKLAAHYGLK